MKRRAWLAIIPALLLIPTSCNKADVDAFVKKNKPTILKLVDVAATRGAEEGLKAWAKKKPDVAKEAGVALSKNTDDILKYLNGDSIGSSEAVDLLINSSLFTNVPDEVKVCVLAASAVLDVYLPVPSASGYLNQDELDYIKAFVGGLKKGVDSFNSKGVKRTWLR